jgi:hypothetical protein
VQEALVGSDPRRFFRPPYVGGRGWLGVYLDVPGVDWDEIAEIVAEAYRAVAPRRLVGLLDAQRAESDPRTRPTAAVAGEAPLILSAVLDAPVQRRLDALRRAHFPPERNHLDAHVTLFHHLPGGEEDALSAAVERAARCPAPPVEVTSLRSLGSGVAVVLASPGLAGIRTDLARAWAPWLTAQDRAERDLHVTVQNKVAPEVARALLVELSAGFVPERTRAVALALWRYRGGPWEPVARFAFVGEDGAPDDGSPSQAPDTTPGTHTRSRS